MTQYRVFQVENNEVITASDGSRLVYGQSFVAYYPGGASKPAFQINTADAWQFYNLFKVFDGPQEPEDLELDIPPSRL